MRRPGRRGGGPLRLVAALALGALGGGAFAAAGAPAPWLSGSMTAVAAAAIAGFDAPVPTAVRTPLFVFLGLSMGAGVDPETLARLGSWPASLALLAVTMVAVGWAVYAFLRRSFGWDAHSAFFAAIPGALSYVLILAQSSRADLAKVALSQSLRVFLLVAVLPAAILAATDAVPSPAGSPPDALHLAMLAAAGIVGALVGRLLRIPAGDLVGPFAASTALYVTGLVEGRMPPSLLIAGSVALGVIVGLRFTGVKPALLRTTMVSGLGAFVVSGAVAGVGAALTSMLVGVPLAGAAIAFAPGGLDAMMLLAFALGVDPAYVAAHQLARFLAVALLVPLFARAVLGRGWNRS